MSKMKLHNKEGGIAVFSIILAMVLIFGAIAAVFVSSSSLNGASTGQDVQVAASGLVDQGATLVSAFQNMEARGTTASAITYDSTTATGMFTPVTGSTTYQHPNPAVFIGSVPTIRRAWVYKSNNVKIKGIGIDANGDYVFMVRGISQKVCQQIDNYVLGTTTIPTTAITAATFVASGADDTTTMITDVTAVDMSAVAAVNRLGAACIASSDGEYIYYVVAEPG